MLYVIIRYKAEYSCGYNLRGASLDIRTSVDGVELSVLGVSL